MKDLDLKESETTEAETLEHCLTVIQGVLDMDDFEQAYNYLSRYTKALLSQQRKEVLEEIEEKEIVDNGELYSTEYKNGFNDALEQIKYLINKQ